MPYFENAKEFRISGGRVTDLKRCKSDHSNDQPTKAGEMNIFSRSDSSTGRMIVIGQGSATRVVVSPTTSRSRPSSRAPSRASSPKSHPPPLMNREPSLTTQSPGQQPLQPPALHSRSTSSSSTIVQQAEPWVALLPDNILAQSSQSQSAPSSTDMAGFARPGAQSALTFPVPSPSMPSSPVTGTTPATQPATSFPVTQSEPSPVSGPVFGPAEYPGTSQKPGNKISRSGTNSSGGEEEDKKKKKKKRGFFGMWAKRQENPESVNP